MAVNVARIYEQTIRPGYSYCLVCLRSEAETSLVTPVKLTEFTNALKLPIFDSKTYGSVCYVCEALAETALRLYQACKNAVSIKNVCHSLKNMKADDPVPEWLRKSVLGCNAQLKEYRRRTLLNQTEVLVVDSTGVEWSAEPTGQDTTRINVPTIPLERLVPVEPTDIETVVLDDDEEETIEEPPLPTLKPIEKPSLPASTPVQSLPLNFTKAELPKLVPIGTLLESKSDANLAALLPDQMKIISRHQSETNTFVLHPVVIGNNGKLVVPSLAGWINDGQLCFDPDLYVKLPLIDCTGMTYVIQSADTSKPVENNETTEYIIENNIQSENETEEILPDIGPTRTKRIRHYGTNKISKVLLPDTKKKVNTVINKIDTVNKNIVLYPSETVSQSQGTKYVVDLDTVNTMLSNNSDKNPIAVISNVMSTSESVSSDGFGVIKEVVSRAPSQLVEKSGIDWEDKIPMDVISFVDTTDPKDRELIVPDRLPVNQQQPTLLNMQLSDLPKLPEYSIIDLC